MEIKLCIRDNALFVARRQKLIEQLEPYAIVLLPAAKESIRNGDTHYPFRQQSNFYYLTGFSEPEALAVIISHPQQQEFILFNRPNDPKIETWTGKRTGQKGACQQYGAHRAYPYHELKQQLAVLMTDCRCIYYPFNQDQELEALIFATIQSLQNQARKRSYAPSKLFNIDPLLHEMRLLKSEDEISLIRQAVDLSVKAHRQAMRACKPGIKEYELQAEIEYQFLCGASISPAYPTIVASGSNACTLHYIENNCELKAGDLILIDAGAEYLGYAADITRTFPVNGQFSTEQKLLYNLVLKAQLAVLDKIRPGVPWNVLQETVVQVLTEGLVSLGILSGNIEKLMRMKAYEEFYMHGSGHWLGLDVHDVGDYQLSNDLLIPHMQISGVQASLPEQTNFHWRTLEPGMVLTVEPGLYIKGQNPRVNKKWWNIGIRIEDDIVVTASSCEILSRDLPKTVEEIEALMAKEV